MRTESVSGKHGGMKNASDHQKDGKQVRQEMEQPEKIKKYDMIVTGMGTAGIFAALAASEKDWPYWD